MLRYQLLLQVVIFYFTFKMQIPERCKFKICITVRNASWSAQSESKVTLGSEAFQGLNFSVSTSFHPNQLFNLLLRPFTHSAKLRPTDVLRTS